MEEDAELGAADVICSNMTATINDTERTNGAFEEANGEFP